MIVNLFFFLVTGATLCLLLWTDPVGIKFFTYAICSEIVGILVIRKLANIKV